MAVLAFIGGTGFDLRGPASPFANAHDEAIQTRFGLAHITHAQLNDQSLIFLHRHARPDQPGRKDVPPHRINYRANIAALKQLGVTGILASTAVGGLRSEWHPGTLVCLDDLIDLTTNRHKTFFDERAIHVDVTRPYCGHLRQQLLDAAGQENIELYDGGTYICTDGPRFETGAEIRAYRSWGADVVGMTGSPEAFLAREAEMAYAGVSIVTNLAAGIAQAALSHEEVLDAMNAALPTLAQLFLATARAYRDDPTTESRTATDGFVTAEHDPITAII